MTPFTNREMKEESNSGCAGCAVGGRRDFVQSAIRGVAAIVGLSAMGGSSAFAQYVSALPNAGGSADEKKYPLPATDGVLVDADNDLIVARVGNNAFAFSIACPHQSTAVKWLGDDHIFQCPKHKSKFTPTGELISGKAERNLDRLPVKLDGTTLVVDTSREIRSDKDLEGWKAALVIIPA